MEEEQEMCTHLSLGMQAPDFEAMTTQGNMKLSDYKGKWVILFSHPGDFTPICTTEFVAFARAYSHFQNKNAELIGLSVDSNSSHLAWLYNIYLSTGIEIPFPVIADSGMNIAKMYNMIAPDISSTDTVRNVFFIDLEQKIRAILVYPKTNGRYIPELLRLLDALQMTDEKGVLTPANWMPEQPVVVKPPATYEDLIKRTQNPEGLQCVDWYLCFKNEHENK